MLLKDAASGLSTYGLAFDEWAEAMIFDWILAEGMSFMGNENHKFSKVSNHHSDGRKYI